MSAWGEGRLLGRQGEGWGACEIEKVFHLVSFVPSRGEEGVRACEFEKVLHGVAFVASEVGERRVGAGSKALVLGAESALVETGFELADIGHFPFWFRTSRNEMVLSGGTTSAAVWLFGENGKIFGGV
jgi:hypothetical protein